MQHNDDKELNAFIGNRRITNLLLVNFNDTY